MEYWTRSMKAGDNKIETAKLYESYCEFAKQSKGRPVQKSEFGKKINKMCPKVQKKQITIKEYPESKRANMYQFPALEICRKEFEEYIDMEIDWPEDVDEEKDNFDYRDEEYENLKALYEEARLRGHCAN